MHKRNGITVEEKEAICQKAAENLKVMRAILNWRVGDLAQAVGTTQRHISEIESGKRTLSWTLFVALVAVFGLNAKTLTSPIYHTIVTDRVILAISDQKYDADALMNEMDKIEQTVKISE